MVDPDSFEGVRALVEAFRSVLGLMKDALGFIPDGEEKEAATKALENAEKAAGIAEAEIAAQTARVDVLQQSHEGCFVDPKLFLDVRLQRLGWVDSQAVTLDGDHYARLSQFAK